MPKELYIKADTDGAKSIFTAATRREYLSTNAFPESLSFGPDFDKYVRLIRDTAKDNRNKEVSAEILAGVTEKDLGVLFLRSSQFKIGTWGLVKKPDVSNNILQRLGAAIIGSSHTHPADPPYFHLHDPRGMAYGEVKFNSGVIWEFGLVEAIISPHQVGIMFATKEAREYIKTNRPIQWKNISNLVIEPQVRQLERELGWPQENNVAEALKSITRRILATNWWIGIGMAVYMCSDIDSESPTYIRLKHSDKPLDFLKQYFQLGLTSPYMRDNKMVGR